MISSNTKFALKENSPAVHIHTHTHTHPLLLLAVFTVLDFDSMKDGEGVLFCLQVWNKVNPEFATMLLVNLKSWWRERVLNSVSGLSCEVSVRYKIKCAKAQGYELAGVHMVYRALWRLEWAWHLLRMGSPTSLSFSSKFFPSSPLLPRHQTAWSHIPKSTVKGTSQASVNESIKQSITPSAGPFGAFLYSQKLMVQI